MNLVHSTGARPGIASPKLTALLETISEGQLRTWVEGISVPRHFAAEPEANRATAAWLADVFKTLGFITERQGSFANILAFPQRELEGAVLVGAHYDSVPKCPGADDNGSAVAAMLGCAAACSLWRPVLPVIFVGFNCEEDGLAGSREFVARYLPKARTKICRAHILEMVGYTSSAAQSQRIPTGLPVKISDRGDFLGLLSNGRSNPLMDSLIDRAATYTPQLPVTGLKVRLGLEKYFPVLARSDHAPFWAQDIPTILWTDTSEFRNSNYHCRTDTPDKLNFGFLRLVTQLLTATTVEQALELDQERL